MNNENLRITGSSNKISLNVNNIRTKKKWGSLGCVFHVDSLESYLLSGLFENIFFGSSLCAKVSIYKIW